MDTIELITKAYTMVADGSRKVELIGESGQKVTAYLCGTIIRIDVKE